MQMTYSYLHTSMTKEEITPVLKILHTYLIRQQDDFFVCNIVQKNNFFTSKHLAEDQVLKKGFIIISKAKKYTKHSQRF